MPKMDWAALPRGIRDHLLDRARLREISARDLALLLEWIKTNPVVPDGSWCKDFGSFTLAGEGRYPKTFLSKDQPCIGERI
jgi:hypothetical protein